MKGQLTFLPLLLIVTTLTAQEGIPGKVQASFVQVRNNDIRSNKPVKRPCLLWLPAAYSDSSNLPFHPLLVYVHDSKGGGSLNGNNINALKINSPFNYLQNKKWNGNAGYGGNCGQPGFIVFALQGNRGSIIDAAELSYAIGQLLIRFRIDENRIILTGINEGAETMFRYLFDTKLPYQPRLVLPMSVPVTPDHAALATVAKKGIKLLAFTFEKDKKPGFDYRSATIKLVDIFNKAVLNSAKLTITPGAHCCWNKYYDPAFKEADNDAAGQQLNIYEWIMKNISWGDAGPPVYTCDDYVNTPYKLAGYISRGRQIKKETGAAKCSTPVYTIDGRIKKGCIIYVQRSGDTMPGNNLHYGYSTSKLRAAVANKDLVIDANGIVVAIE